MKTRKSSVLYLGDEIPGQVDSFQRDWEWKKASLSGSVWHSAGILLNWNHIPTHVSKVSVFYFFDFVKARVQIARFLWKCWNAWHVGGHLLAINGTTEADAHQTCWHLWNTHKSHHRITSSLHQGMVLEFKIKSRVIGLDVLCRQIRWGHLSVPGTLHNLAFSHIHQKKCGRLPQQVLHNQLWDTCWKNVTYSWAKTLFTDGFWDYCSVCIMKDLVTWRVHNRLLLRKKKKVLFHTPNLGPVLLSFHLLNHNNLFTSGLLAGLGCAAAESIHGSKIDVKNKVPLCIMFFSPSLLVKNNRRLPHWILR